MGAVLAVEEPVRPSPQAPNEAGWQTDLAPARNPVQPTTRRQIGRWQAYEVTTWLKATGLRKPKVALWPFSGVLLVVATELRTEYGSDFSLLGPFRLHHGTAAASRA